MKHHSATPSFLLAVAATATLVAASAACGSGATDSLLGDDPLGTSGGNGGNGGDWGNGGGGPVYNADGGAQAPVRAKLFQALLPDLEKKCGGACHTDGTNANNYKWLAKPDPYASIKAYPGIVGDDIYSSKLLNRPDNHPTGTLIDVGNETLLAAVTTWLSAEAVALKQAPLPSTDATDVTGGSIDLAKAGVPGAKITFTTSALATSLRFANVVVVAPSTTGIHLVAPSFVMVPTTGPEVVDTTFSTVDISVPAGGTATIGALFYFFNWTTGSKVRVQFQKIEQATIAGDAGAASGCKDVATFQNSAAPTLISTCVSCHGGGNGNATASLDLSKLSGAPDYAAACTQAHFKINLADKTQSNLLLAPLNGSGLNHPVKPFANTGANGYTSLLTWINKE